MENFSSSSSSSSSSSHWSVVTHWGRNGTNGNVDPYNFGILGDANNFYNDTLKKKLKKGYVKLRSQHRRTPPTYTSGDTITPKVKKQKNVFDPNTEKDPLLAQVVYDIIVANSKVYKKLQPRDAVSKVEAEANSIGFVCSFVEIQDIVDKILKVVE
jgi:predicted DNA-binding WGR domain protein